MWFFKRWLIFLQNKTKHPIKLNLKHLSICSFSPTFKGSNLMVFETSILGKEKQQLKQKLKSRFECEEPAEEQTAAVRKLHCGYFIYSWVTILLKELEEHHQKIQSNINILSQVSTFIQEERMKVRDWKTTFQLGFIRHFQLLCKHISIPTAAPVQIIPSNSFCLKLTKLGIFSFMF